MQDVPALCANPNPTAVGKKRVTSDQHKAPARLQLQQEGLST